MTEQEKIIKQYTDWLREFHKTWKPDAIKALRYDTPSN